MVTFTQSLSVPLTVLFVPPDSYSSKLEVRLLSKCQCQPYARCWCPLDSARNERERHTPVCIDTLLLGSRQELGEVVAGELSEDQAAVW